MKPLGSPKYLDFQRLFIDFQRFIKERVIRLTKFFHKFYTKLYVTQPALVDYIFGCDVL